VGDRLKGQLGVCCHLRQVVRRFVGNLTPMPLVSHDHSPLESPALRIPDRMSMLTSLYRRPFTALSRVTVG